MIKLRGGDVCLFARADSGSWYAKFRLPDGPRQESLKTIELETARERALVRFDELLFRSKTGKSADPITFTEAADAYLKALERDAKVKTVSMRKLYDARPIIETYLKPFFAATMLDQIRAADVERFDAWRMTPEAISRSRRIRRRQYGTVAPRTINKLHVFLRAIFKHAAAQGWIDHASIPVMTGVKQKISESRKRSYAVFEKHEYVKLKEFMSSWVLSEGMHQQERWRREAIRDYLTILFASGLRNHELFEYDSVMGCHRGLRWRDVKFFETTGGKRLAELAVDGKTGPRRAITLPEAREAFERRKLVCFDHTPDQFVMAFPDGHLMKGFQRGVKRLFRASGLLVCPRTGKERTVYSSRHSFITWRLQANRSPMDVARNCGTSIAMLEANYFHFIPRVAAESLTAGE